MRRLTLLAALALAPGAASAEDLAAALAAPEGAEATRDRVTDPGEAALPLRPAGAEGPVAERFAGRVTRRAWRAEDGRTTLAVARDMEAALAALGFEPVLRCAAEECGGFAFRNAIEVFDAPAMAVNLEDFRQLTMRAAGEGAGEGGDRYVSALMSRLAGWTLVQIVAVEDAVPAAATVSARPPADPPSAAPPPTGPSPHATAEAPAEAAPPAPSPSVAAPPEGLIATLRADGRAVLDGVAFVPGSTSLAEAAALALDAAAEALRAAPELEVMVVGHTDDSGSLAVNLRVSRARAESVAAALRARGVAAGRLSAEGAAFLAPRASNADEAGRALNRRVELVVR